LSHILNQHKDQCVNLHPEENNILELLAAGNACYKIFNSEENNAELNAKTLNQTIRKALEIKENFINDYAIRNK